jgi:hypothetical protein
MIRTDAHRLPGFGAASSRRRRWSGGNLLPLDMVNPEKG